MSVSFWGFPIGALADILPLVRENQGEYPSFPSECLFLWKDINISETYLSIQWKYGMQWS